MRLKGNGGMVLEQRDIQALIDLNNAFYRRASASFSRSRQTAWPGWERVASLLRPQDATVFDAACGNLRFERYLRQRFGDGRFTFSCVDSCRGLVGDIEGVRFEERDILEALRANEPLFAMGEERFDVAVSFGFMHHIPTYELRARFLGSLLQQVKPGGIVAVSFWRFMNDEKLAKKARATTRDAQEKLGLALEDDDYLLGWNDEPDLYRYCHHFSDEEISRLVRDVSNQATLTDRFEADGRTNALNGYVVFHTIANEQSAIRHQSTR